MGLDCLPIWLYCALWLTVRKLLGAPIAPEGSPYLKAYENSRFSRPRRRSADQRHRVRYLRGSLYALNPDHFGRDYVSALWVGGGQCGPAGLPGDRHPGQCHHVFNVPVHLYDRHRSGGAHGGSLLHDQPIAGH